MSKMPTVTDIQKEMSRLYTAEQADVTELRVAQDVHDTINAECDGVTVAAIVNRANGRAVKLVTDASLEPGQIVYYHG